MKIILADIPLDISDASQTLVSWVGTGVLGALVVFIALWAIKVILRAFISVTGAGSGSGDKPVDYWEGYTPEDDARDRMEAGLLSNPNWDESAKIQDEGKAGDAEFGGHGDGFGGYKDFIQTSPGMFRPRDGWGE